MNLLLKQLEYIIKNSQFYQRKFKKISLDPLWLYENFDKIPFTTKKELLEDQNINSPYGSNLCVDSNQLIRVHKTSGTSNKPLLIAMTKKDVKNTTEVGSKCFKLAGLNKQHTVIHCLSYNMWMGGYTDHQSLEKTGANVIPFGVGNTNALIEIIQTLKPEAIHCTPSYLAKIEEEMIKSEMQIQPIELQLKLGLFGAESGLQNPNFRKSIEGKWGLSAMNANYGMADVLSMFGSECKYKNGLHFMGKDHLLVELIDIHNKSKIKLVEGAIGELVLTNLTREAQPVIRYKTNDIIKILSTEKCKCGEKGFRFEVVGRNDDMFVVKGVNVFVSAIENIISHHLDLLSGQFQIYINEIEPIDRIEIKAEINNTIDMTNIAIKNLENKLILDFKNRLNISPKIYLLNFGELSRTELKSKKLFKTLKN